MNESTEFTAKEKYLIALYRDDLDGLAHRALVRWLWFLIPSAALVAYAWMTGQPEFMLLGYGLLFVNAVGRLSKGKRGMATLASILRKYEAQLQNKGGAS
jgi:hypothetical protein